jgi:hypothetical protein
MAGCLRGAAEQIVSWNSAKAPKTNRSQLRPSTFDQYRPNDA